MPVGFCSIAHCGAASVRSEFCGATFSCFCEPHLGAFAKSPEGARAFALAARPEGITDSCFVSALWDFRTRLELEQRRDGDVQVISARGGR